MITIYGKPNCPHCDTAKELCRAAEVAYEYVDIVDAGIGAMELSDIMGRPVRTVPQIVAGDLKIGSVDELRCLLAGVR